MMLRTSFPCSGLRAAQRAPSVVAVLSLLASAAWGQSAPQTLPGDGTQLRPLAEPCGSCAAPAAGAPPAAASGPASQGGAATFRLNDLRLNGAQALSAEELRSTTAPYIGRDVSLADLEALAQALTQRYRERGYFLAQALVPVQTVRDGIVEISVIEGRVGKVDVERAEDAPISEARVRAFLKAVSVGQVVNAQTYERAMLLLSDQPGLRVGSGLSAGLEPGSTDLRVEVNPSRRWQFSVEADNHGTETSGRYRAGATVRVNSPFGIGDNLDARFMVSNGQALKFGRLSYEVPLGSGGLRAGVGVGRVNYELAGEFSELGAQGTADVVDVSLSYPVIRQRGQNLFVRLTADKKRLHDAYTAVHFSAKKNLQGVGLGWAWERRDEWGGGGYWASSGNFYRGRLSLHNSDVLNGDQGWGGYRTAGGFSKLTLQISRLQALMPGHTLYVSLGGQWASKNLDSYEKLALGGARAVRAYPSSEVLVDQGLLGTVEWRWALNNEFTPFVFYDVGHGRLHKQRGAFDTGADSRSLRGAGVGLSWVKAGNFSVNATLAWRAGTDPAKTDGGGRHPRLYVQAQKSF